MGKETRALSEDPLLHLLSLSLSFSFLGCYDKSLLAPVCVEEMQHLFLFSLSALFVAVFTHPPSVFYSSYQFRNFTEITCLSENIQHTHTHLQMAHLHKPYRDDKLQDLETYNRWESDKIS